jgi:hypothetical protein
MISEENRKLYATHSERPKTTMFGLSKGKTVTRMDIRQAALELQTEIVFVFGRHNLT